MAPKPGEHTVRRVSVRGMAQLVARCVWDAEVLGSSPSTPTFYLKSYPLLKTFAILLFMTTKIIYRYLFLFSCTFSLALWLGACATLDEIGERPVATNTFAPPRTATFGGRVSVWMVSPTGAVNLANNSTPLAGGAVVGPVGTATAISQTLVAATQTAAAPPIVPNFQPSECPSPSGRIPEPPPDDFAAFPAAIGTFLSGGGSPRVLENELRALRAITEKGGVIQDDTDLTGDGVPEVIVNIFNPFIYNENAIINAGQLLVYGCDKGGYRLLYQTPSSPGLALPVLHRVGDMNGDVRAELVYDIQTCSSTSCTREGNILTWNPITGVFEPLNNAPIIAVNGRLGVVDIDNDGILELTASSNPSSDIAAGPRRSVVDIWDWTGKNYILAARQESGARYRIHVLHDADAALRQQAWQTALETYRTVRNDETLAEWTLPNEFAILKAFATYRLVTVYGRLGDGRMETAMNLLRNENPIGSPGEVYAAMGQAFVDNYRATGSVNAGCQAALGVAASRPEALTYLNSYGYANPSYTLTDLCPF